MRKVWLLSALSLVALAGCLVIPVPVEEAGREVLLASGVFLPRAQNRVVIRTDADQPLRALRFRVAQGPVVIRSVTVLYANGQREIFRVGWRFPVPGRARVLDLSGGVRYVRGIVLFYAIPRNALPGPIILDVYGVR